MAKTTADQSKTVALAKPTDLTFMALSNQEAFENLRTTLSETIGDELSPFDFDELTIPAGGGMAWNVPGLEGVTTAETVQGVLVYVQAARSYYREAYDGGSNPPDCFSPDGRCGYGDPGGDCKVCPFGQFGSAVDQRGNPAKGQACAERKHLLLLPANSLIPLFVNLPPTSVKAFEKYSLRLGGAGLLWNGVVTEIGLEPDKSGGGITYSKATFRMAGLLPEAERMMAKQYSDAMGSLIRSRLIDDARSRVAEQAPAPSSEE